MSERQLSGLLGALQLGATAGSPLAAVRPRAPRITPTQRDTLIRVGWMDAKGRMTDAAVSALWAVLQPQVRIELVLGTPDTLLSTALYAGGSEGAAPQLDGIRLVLLNVDERGSEPIYRFQTGLSLDLIADRLRDQLMVGPLTAPTSLRADLTPGGSVALLGALDARLHALLAARLDREPDPAAVVSPAAVWETIVEGRAARDLTWAVTLFSMLMPFLPWTPERPQVVAGLEEMAAARLLSAREDGRYNFGRELLALADALYPIVTFGCVYVTRWAQGEDAGGRALTGPGERVVALVRGRSAVLMVQLDGWEDGEARVAVDVLSDVEVAELLFQMSQAPEMVVPPGAPAADNGRGG
jgi:hypothetical protein